MLWLLWILLALLIVIVLIVWTKITLFVDLHHVRDNDGAGKFLAVGGDQAGQSRLFAVAVIFHLDEVFENPRTIKTKDLVPFAMLGIIRERAAP